MSTSIDISTNDIEVIPSNNVVVETDQNDVCVQPYTDVEVIGSTKEYTIIGDAIFASQNVGEAPQWLTSIIDSVIGTALDSSLTDLVETQRDLVSAIEELGIANNNYNEIINIDATVDEAVTTRLAALNANIENANATIAELQITKASANEASAIALDVISSSLNDTAAGTIGGTVSQLNSSINTLAGSVSSTRTLVESRYGELNQGMADLQMNVNAAVDGVTTAFAYNSVIKIGDDYYRSGFGLQTSVITGGAGTVNNPYNSEFWINAQNFVLTDPGTNNKVLMNADGLYFQNSSGVTTRYLQNVKVFQNHPNNQQITLTNLKHLPSIVMGPGNMPVYRAANSSQDQSFVFEITNVSNQIAVNGSYSFTPKAELRLSSGVIGGTLSGGFNNSNSTSYSNPYTAGTNLSGITLNFTVGSTRGTGTSSTYYYRKCVVTVQTSTDGVNYTNRTSSNINFGASLSTVSSNITYTGAMASGTRVRLKFDYSDAGGTFTSGVIEYDYDQTTVTDTAQRTVTASTIGPGGQDSKSLVPSMSYSTPSGWSVYNVVYTLEYSYYVTTSGSGNCFASAVGDDNLFNHRVDNGASSGSSGLTNWSALTRTKSSFSTSHIRAYATAYAGFSGESATAIVSYRNVKATIYIRKVKTSSTTASNNASSMTYNANAASGVVLSQGTLNIITVE